MKTIAILKITSFGQDCYECGGSREVQKIVNWEEISDEDYNLLAMFIASQKYDSVERYMMIEQYDYKDVKQTTSFQDVLELAKQREKTRLAAAQRYQKQAEEKAAKDKIKAQERKRKQLEKLKKELGEE